MKLTLLKELESPFLSRKRLNFEADYSGSRTPSNEEIKKTISTSQKVKEELIAIRHIYPKFGKSTAKVIVHIYKTLQDLKKYEPKIKKKKEKAEGAPAEKPKEEKPKEEKVKEKTDAKEESKEQKAE